MPFLIPDDRLLAMLREDAPYGDDATLGLVVELALVPGMKASAVVKASDVMVGIE